MKDHQLTQAIVSQAVSTSQVLSRRLPELERPMRQVPSVPFVSICSISDFSWSQNRWAQFWKYKSWKVWCNPVSVIRNFTGAGSGGSCRSTSGIFQIWMGLSKGFSENDFSSRQILEGLVVQLLHSSFVRSIYCSIYVQFIEGGMNQPLADGHWPPRPHLSGIKLGFLSVCHYHYLFLVLLLLTTIIIIIIVSSITCSFGFTKRSEKHLPLEEESCLLPHRRRARGSCEGLTGGTELVDVRFECRTGWCVDDDDDDGFQGNPQETTSFFSYFFPQMSRVTKDLHGFQFSSPRSQVAGPDGPARGLPPRGQAPLIAAAAAGHASVKLKQFSLHRDFLSDWKKSDILWFCLTFKQVELGLPFFLSDLRPEKEPGLSLKTAQAVLGCCWQPLPTCVPWQRHGPVQRIWLLPGRCLGNGNRWTDGIGFSIFRDQQRSAMMSHKNP